MRERQLGLSMAVLGLGLGAALRGAEWAEARRSVKQTITNALPEGTPDKLMNEFGELLEPESRQVRRARERREGRANG